MEQYFFKITASFSDKNKLYAAFSKYVKDLDGTLIKDEVTLQAFLQSLHSRLSQLNEHFSRCKSIELKEIKEGYSINPDARTIGLRVEGSWHASLYKIESTVELEDGFLQYYIL